MGDAVYQAMDRMVPALEDLQIRGLFNADEVRLIVAKRRDFEFLLRRRTARKADFLRYLEYEINLDELRRIRKEKAGLAKSTISDFSGRQLIHFIFERALRKFRGDLELWLQFLDYCQSTGSNKAHSRALAQALQIFPRAPGLWIRAASYEYFDNASPPAARVLMQRGLRLNGATSALMWTQYFKLELLYVQKLRGRRMALGIVAEEKKGREKKTKKRRPEQGQDEGEGGKEKEGEERGQHPVSLPHLEDEAEDSEAEEEEDKEEEDSRARSVREVLAGAVPRVIYRSAIAARPRDFEMRLTCLDILASLVSREEAEEEESEGESGGSGFEALAQEILEGIERDMGIEDGAWARATYALKTGSGSTTDSPTAAAVTEGEEGEEEVEGSKKRKKGRKKRRRSSGAEEGVIGEEDVVDLAEWKKGLSAKPKAYLAALERGLSASSPSSAKMWMHYLKGLTEVLEAPAAVVMKAMSKAEEASGPLPPSIDLQWVDLLKAEEGEGKEEQVREVLIRAVKAHPNSAALWEARLQAEAAAAAGHRHSQQQQSSKKQRRNKKGQEQAEGRGSGSDEGKADVEKVMEAALKALGSSEEVKGERSSSGSTTSNSRLIANLWLIYLRWKIGNATNSDSDSNSEEEEEEVAEVGSFSIGQAFERAIASTRGKGRIDLCRLWYDWAGLGGLEKALGFMSHYDVAEEKEGEVGTSRSDLASLCLDAIEAELKGGEKQGGGKDGKLRAFFEAVLTVVGKGGGDGHEAVEKIWDLYEEMERLGGEHRRANNVRWRREQMHK